MYSGCTIYVILPENDKKTAFPYLPGTAIIVQLCNQVSALEDPEIEQFSILLIREEHAIFWNLQV